MQSDIVEIVKTTLDQIKEISTLWKTKHPSERKGVFTFLVRNYAPLMLYIRVDHLDELTKLVTNALQDESLTKQQFFDLVEQWFKEMASKLDPALLHQQLEQRERELNELRQRLAEIEGNKSSEPRAKKRPSKRPAPSPTDFFHDSKRTRDDKADTPDQETQPITSA